MNKLYMIHCTIVTPTENFWTKQIKSIPMKYDFKKQLFTQEKLQDFCDY